MLRDTKRRRRVPKELSHKNLLSNSISASIQNAAGPIGLALQHVFLGARSPQSLAAFGVCVSVSNLGTTVFQFFVDGSTSRVGESVQKRKRKMVAKVVKRSFIVSILSGCIAGLVLFLSADVLFNLLGKDGNDSKLEIGRGYYGFRCFSMPLKTSSNAAIGVLGGYGFVHAVSLMNSCIALAQVVSVVVVLHLSEKKSERNVLDMLGVAYMVIVGVHMCVGWLLVFFKNPIQDVVRTSELVLDDLEEEEEEEENLEEERKQYWQDAFDMFTRSILLQASFFVAVVVASRRLPVEGLAAHHLTAQLWLVCSYVVDGFATIATVFGARLYSMKKINLLHILTVRLLSYGTTLGIGFCVLFLSLGQYVRMAYAGENEVTKFFLTKTWIVVSFAQPINSVVFVLDGMMYATRSFRFARGIMISGVGLIFLPTILTATLLDDDNQTKVIARIWIGKLLLNVWRMIGLIYRVFFCVLREKDEEINEREDYDPLIQSEEEKDDDDDSFTPLLSDDGL